MVEATDALTAYRTNPHLDQRDRGLEAASLMARTLRGEIRPVQAAPAAGGHQHRAATHRRAPMLHPPGDAPRDRQSPGHPVDERHLGFPYADVAEMGSAAIAVADGNTDLASTAANDLGRTILGPPWRMGRRIDCPARRGLRAGHACSAPVCLLDMGDNVGGGAPGDGTLLAHLLNRPGIGKSFVCLHDPAAATQHTLDAGVADAWPFSMGGKSFAVYGSPVEAEVTVRHISDGVFTDLRPRHGGTTHYNIGRLAVVETAAGLTIMLTTRRAFPVSIVQLTHCGIDPSAFRFIVAKGVHAPVTAYAEACKSFVRANTPGITSADPSAFEYYRRRRPLFPFETPGDAARLCWGIAVEVKRVVLVGSALADAVAWPVQLNPDPIRQSPKRVRQGGPYEIIFRCQL